MTPLAGLASEVDGASVPRCLACHQPGIAPRTAGTHFETAAMDIRRGDVPVVIMKE